MFTGPIEANGVVIDECKVSQSVAANSGFWSYIDAQKRAGREVGTEDKGIFSWRLSIQYLDQGGAPALIDSKTSVVTAEAHEFYRNGVEGEKQESAQVMVAKTLEKLADVLQNIQANMADNVRQMAIAALQPVTELSGRVQQMSKEETQRADEMTKVAFKGIRDAQPQPDFFDGMAKVIPAGAVAIKTLKDLLN